MNDTRPPIADIQLTADVVIFTVQAGQLSVVLVHRDEAPFKSKLALPGGFIWQNETADQAAKRLLRDKVGAADVFFEQLYTFDAIARDPRGRIASVAHFALVPETLLTNTHSSTHIVPVSEVGELAFDHNQILQKAVARVRNKLSYSNIAYSLLPELFTLSQLQLVYETVLGHELDKRNFRKKIMSLDLLQETGRQTAKARHRPATLYAFKHHGYAELSEPAF